MQGPEHAFGSGEWCDRHALLHAYNTIWYTTARRSLKMMCSWPIGGLDPHDISESGSTGWDEDTNLGTKMVVEPSIKLLCPDNSSKCQNSFDYTIMAQNLITQFVDTQSAVSTMASPQRVGWSLTTGSVRLALN
jgi:hypothetical protein